MECFSSRGGLLRKDAALLDWLVMALFQRVMSGIFFFCNGSTENEFEKIVEKTADKVCEIWVRTCVDR